MGFFSDFFSKPASTMLTITSANGFHLRPVAQFVNLAKTFPCELTAEFKQKTVNAKAVNTLLSLGLEQEDSFKLQARGKDAKEAVQRLEAFFAELMQGDREMETLDKEDSLYEGPVIEGEIISRGIAIAAVHRYKERENRTENGVGFSEALAKSLEELDALYRTHAQNEDAGIYLAQRELLQAIAEQAGSLEIFEETISEESARLVGSKMEAKITDYKDILQRVRTIKIFCSV
ncbi:MAG: hypothetical protein B5M46_04800 [Epsilonproteobacteria bacterium 4484_20]|nr:MAG: hypothetical protein B5M46_04800 [Epsilonproteobacteria bacterium 4484_20]